MAPANVRNNPADQRREKRNRTSGEEEGPPSKRLRHSPSVSDHLSPSVQPQNQPLKVLVFDIQADGPSINPMVEYPAPPSLIDLQQLGTAGLGKLPRATSQIFPKEIQVNFEGDFWDWFNPGREVSLDTK